MASRWRTWKPLLIEAFLISNYAFLIVDIFTAHSVNRFQHWAEWIPFWFSMAAALVLLPGVSRSVSQVGDWKPTRAGWAVGTLAIIVGIAGVFLHLDGHFFSEQPIRNLVYAAPFAAPLAYAGLGFLLLANRMLERRSTEWGRWVLFLALGGFVGNFALSLLDHAQNGFFDWREWLSVIFAAIGVGFLATATFLQPNRGFVKLCAGIMVAEIFIAIVGFGLHAGANLDGPSSNMVDNFIFGAPVFAPLLFANLAVLALIGLWALSRKVI